MHESLTADWTAGNGAPVLLSLPIIVPLLAGAAAALIGWRRGPAWMTVGASAAIALCGVATAVATVDGSVISAGPLRADALSAIMLLTVGVVAVVATWAGIYHIDADMNAGRSDPRRARFYGMGVPLFLASASLAVLAGNLGVLWTAIEAMTILAAFLIGLAGTRTSWEAKWKYVVIASVGLALACVGTVLVYVAATTGHRSLDWAYLSMHAAQLDRGVLRIAFPLLLIGFGAMAGLVPLHSWLPDAHGQAPAPVSALMSGCLLSVAVYALLRYHSVVMVSLGPGFLRVVLLAVALASLVIAASMLLAQRDYMRLLAYSSMQYMALAVFGLAVGTPIAVAATLLHLLGHGLGKAILFCGAGQICAREGSTEFAHLRAILSRHPTVAGISALALAALLGFPPFSPFASMHTLLSAGLDSGLTIPTVLVATTIVVIFIAVVARVTPMFFSPAPQAAALPYLSSSRAQIAPLVVGLIGLALLGTLSFSLQHLLMTAGMIVTGR